MLRFVLELGLVVESLPVPEALTDPEPLVVPVRDDGAVDDLVELVSDEHPQNANPKLQERTCQSLFLGSFWYAAVRMLAI